MYGDDDWLAQVREDVIDPDREIVDPHHHLWNGPRILYDVEEFRADACDGHNVAQTVFVDCHSNYRSDGLDYLKVVGETEFAAAAANRLAEAGPKPRLSAIVAHADLRHPLLPEILDAHEAAGGGLFRGIRQAAACDPEPAHLSIPGRAPRGLYLDTDYQRGAALLGKRGLTVDAWHFHHQNDDFIAFAKAVPGTRIILDHFSTPLGVGPYAGQRDAIFERLKRDLERIADCPNVYAKLGGLAMRDNGYDWDTRPKPLTSDEYVNVYGAYFHHTIACFGANRCMFESNFPMDRRSISYRSLWNAYKKIAAAYPEKDQRRLFAETAREVYSLPA